MKINLDEKIDYRSAFGAAVQKNKVQGDKMTGLCPFHDDKNASFSVDLKKGLYKCFACGEEGNYIDFVAKTRGLSTKEAYKVILHEHGLAEENAKPGALKYTLAMYAAEKGLPLEWLKGIGLSDGTDKDGGGYVKIPYCAEDGKEVTFRKRYPKNAKSRFKWKAGSAGSLLMYGEERLAQIREAGYVYLVEGESDTQTMQFLGLPVLGIPGASNFKEEWVQKLEGLAVYLHIEPDGGGDTFLRQMQEKLKKGAFKGEVFKWSCAEYGVKDPSDLYLAKGAQGARELMEKAKFNGVQIDLYSEIIPQAVEGEPVHLRQPDGWRIGEDGIKKIDERSGQYKIISRTPIMLCRRLRSLETNEEKIEIAFKRDNEWQRAIFQRSTIFQSKSVTCLSDLGCTVTSENAKFVVSFLAAQEMANIDILETAESTGVFGWQSRGRFLPYLEGDIVLDVEPSLKTWAAGYHAEGSLEDWLKAVEGCRRNNIFRFILAASFAAPLLKIVKGRNFMVYNWADSKSGKTAALKCALSVWGDPDVLMANFNATKVALERMAGFYCDLPLGIDERQQAGNKQDYLDSIIYMLANGTGRARGSKGGGLQALNTWRTIILATGEEPITSESSQTGTSTRIIELYGAPFAEEREAGLMYQHLAANYGLAGVEYIKRLLELGAKEIRSRYAEFLAAVTALADEKNGAHAAAIAVVALADSLVGQWFFGDDEARAVDEALRMAEVIAAADAENAARDVNENAAQFLYDWIMGHGQDFSENARGVRLGEIDKSGDCTYIFPTVLNDALAQAGYNSRKTLKYLHRNDCLGITAENTGRIVYSIVRKFEGKPTRFVKIELFALRRLLNIQKTDEFITIEEGDYDEIFDNKKQRLEF